ncbi:hypothetical protein SAY87_013290 [Trapa incisa]|uniref:Protein kinase domain-containing protein n=1 Tax=Trapa incisa TaxID=236973 RepID=A0AAN7KHW8_9MYRT|nr:hypothetical protein SAY87_013290 [Trapa incisa]
MGKVPINLIKPLISPSTYLSLPWQIQILTLPPQFKLQQDAMTLLLFYNCSTSSGPSDRLFNCSAPAAGNGTVLRLYDKDTKMEAASRSCNCKSMVEAPIEVNGANTRETAEALVRRGFWMTWTASKCDVCEGSVEGADSTIQSTTSSASALIDLMPCSVQLQVLINISICPETGKSDSLLKTGLGAGIGALSIIVVLLSVFIIRYQIMHRSLKVLAKNNPTHNSLMLESHVCIKVPIFQYKQLRDATNNFHSSQELGDGDFGTVYYGKLQVGREVAVKRLYEHNYRSVKQFMTEVQILTRLHHKNLVSLYGCTSRHSCELLLVVSCSCREEETTNTGTSTAYSTAPIKLAFQGGVK